MPKKILVFIDWYLPGYKAGGPIRSVSNIITSLKKDFDFFVFTRNSDLGDSQPFKNIISDKWTIHPDNYPVYYASQKALSIKNINKILSEKDYDILYLNGIFSYRFNILPLLLSRFLKKKYKIIVSPRGMLGAGALSLKKKKKKLFLFLAKTFGILRDVTWHASSNHEAMEISKIFGSKAKIVDAMNISLLSANILSKSEKRKGEARFFFLSRISRKKNLLGALKIFKEIKTGNVSFDIYGPMEDELYWKECETVMNSLGKNISVKYKGILSPELNKEVLSHYHFMLFPTLNENYGHVIFESLSAGCPVIISDQTPWKGLEEKKTGWDIPLDNKEKFIKVVERCIGMSGEEYSKWSEIACRAAGKIAKSQDTIEQNRQLFLNS